MKIIWHIRKFLKSFLNCLLCAATASSLNPSSTSISNPNSFGISSLIDTFFLIVKSFRDFVQSLICSILHFRMLWIRVFPTPSSSATLWALFVLHNSITFIRSSKVKKFPFRSHVLELSFNYKTTQKLVKSISTHL